MDIFYKHLNSKNIAIFIAVTGCILMVVLPDITLLSAQKGIALWAESVLPALFPFFICTGFMGSLGITKYLPRGVYIFMISVLSGYPMGARIIGEMRRSGEMDEKSARSIIGFATTSGPAFILGAVGIGMLGSETAGTIIAISHYAGALITGFVFFVFNQNSDEYVKKYRYGKNIMAYSLGNGEIKNATGEILTIFTDSILGALKSLGIILSYIVIFMFITDMIDYCGVIDFITEPHIKAVVNGMFEMTVGCASLSYIEISMSTKIVISSFLVSFGGFSIIGQSMSMLAGSGIKLSYFILIKLCHAFSAAGTAAIICYLMM